MQNSPLIFIIFLCKVRYLISKTKQPPDVDKHWEPLPWILNPTKPLSFAFARWGAFVFIVTAPKDGRESYNRMDVPEVNKEVLW
jgi:hypothetical protein